MPGRKPSKSWKFSTYIWHERTWCFSENKRILKKVINFSYLT